MVSVTQRTKQVTQPRGGYVNRKLMAIHHQGRDGAAVIDHTAENVHPSLVGTAVDYLTRAALGKPTVDVFQVSITGARRLGEKSLEDALLLCEVVDKLGARELASHGNQSSHFMVPNLKNPDWASERDVFTVPDSEAIKAAIELASFDAVVRAGLAAYNRDSNTDPDETTIAHVEIMVGSSLQFVWNHGPVLVDGFTMLGGYTATVNSGDGDFVTVDTVWDFKVSVNPPTKNHTLQLLMYWLMARRSGWNWRPNWNWDHALPASEWSKVWDLDDYLRKHRAWPEDLQGPVPTHLGIYNPRLNSVYRLDVDKIPEEVITAVERDVIGY